MIELYIGKVNTGIRIVPDAKWPGMWRIVKGDRISDMVNLDRAKDASISWVARPKGVGGGEVATWRRRQSGSKAPPVS